MKSIDLPPSASALMESTRSIGYSLPAAVADIIDNSVTAGATSVEIKFMSEDKPYIVIADNGCGMTFEELKNAMQYGSHDPREARSEDDLGRYGLGLKTASLSQCQVLSVISKKDGIVSGCQWNLRHIRKENTWSLLVLEIDEINSMPHVDFLEDKDSGTLVIWQELDRLLSPGDRQRDVLGARMIKVREHLSLVFHRYLSGKETERKLVISMNCVDITPIDPFLSGQSTQAMAEEVILVGDNEKVRVRPYILPHISRLSSSDLKMLGGKDGLRRSQGFYVYRNKRLVVWGTWFRMMVKGDLSKLARIQVDIPNTLDDLWTLDIKKSVAIPPEDVQKNLRVIIDKIAEKSKQTWTYRGKKERKTEKIEPWNRLKTRDGGFFYQINREHILIQKILELHPDLKRPLASLLSIIEERLPLNSLYVDMVQDEKITNNDEQSEKAVLDQLIAILSIFPSPEAKAKALSDFLLIPPFSDHFDYINKNIQKVL